MIPLAAEEASIISSEGFSHSPAEHIPLSGNGSISSTHAFIAKGRLLIVANEIRDSERHRNGWSLTVVGDGAGMKALPLSNDYRDPLIIAKERHRWESSSDSTVHVGIGSGVHPELASPVRVE